MSTNPSDAWFRQIKINQNAFPDKKNANLIVSIPAFNKSFFAFFKHYFSFIIQFTFRPMCPVIEMRLIGSRTNCNGLFMQFLMCPAFVPPCPGDLMFWMCHVIFSLNFSLIFLTLPTGDHPVPADHLRTSFRMNKSAHPPYCRNHTLDEVFSWERRQR